MTAATALGVLADAAVAGWLGDVVDIVWLLCGTASCWIGAGAIGAVASKRTCRTTGTCPPR